jgi:hypothetical protein
VEVPEQNKNASRNVWVLFKPLSAYSQTIEISSPAAAAIARLVNNYYKNNEDETLARVNAMQISERDIMDVLIIADELIKTVTEPVNE